MSCSVLKLNSTFFMQLKNTDLLNCQQHTYHVLLYNYFVLLWTVLHLNDWTLLKGHITLSGFVLVLNYSVRIKNNFCPKFPISYNWQPQTNKCTVKQLCSALKPYLIYSVRLGATLSFYAFSVQLKNFAQGSWFQHAERHKPTMEQLCPALNSCLIYLVELCSTETLLCPALCLC